MGDPRAPQLVRVCTERMRPKDIRKAQALAEQWHPSGEPQAPAVNVERLFKPRPAGSSDN